MELFTDREHQKNNLYRTPDRLQARINLHRRFGTSPIPWFEWLWQHLPALQPGARVLDIGCGPADLWALVAERLPARCAVFPADLSQGMAKKAVERLHFHPCFHPACADIQALPFAASSFHLVTANFMLYHVPDLDAAMQEIRRVLKPGGVFCAATNGQGHLSEVRQLARDISPGFMVGEQEKRFSLETGAHLLEQYFNPVQRFLFENPLEVTETQPLLDYMASTASMAGLPDDAFLKARSIIDHAILEKGSFHIQALSGLFIAYL